MPPRSRRGWKQKADKLWSSYIRQRDKKCQSCGYIHPKQMHSHHIITRGIARTRHDPFNGVLLCPACHFMAHHHQLKFEAFLSDRWAFRDHRQRLMDLAYKSDNKRLKVDYEEVCANLEHLLQEVT